MYQETHNKKTKNMSFGKINRKIKFKKNIPPGYCFDIKILCVQRSFCLRTYSYKMVTQKNVLMNFVNLQNGVDGMHASRQACMPSCPI